ncbi:hypothetical protein [Streptomyces sp. NPDC004284]|uniref:hypothetical protein n=1 Tax=Streptomyces sp. NPDC004284 TaxID=3364695 RepID=UPI0036A00715
MNAYGHPLFPGHPGKEEEAHRELLSRVNRNARREPQDGGAREYSLGTRRLATAAHLGAAL